MQNLVRIVSVAGYNNSAQLAGDSHNTHCMLYPGSVKALLHSTACAVSSPILLILRMFSYDELCLVMLAGMVHGDF